MSGHARNASNNPHIEEVLAQIRRYDDFSTTGKQWTCPFFYALLCIK